ncbi:MAG TPA: adenylate/guanylate cyclase domain-containing protein [Actinomycetota bacterium]
MTIRVVLGDDNVLVREGVRALLGATDGIDVVGVAEDAPTLLAAVDEYLPDVVVTDIKMPPNFQLEGIECAHEIRQRHPGTGVVVLSAHDDEAYALALLGRGDRGLAYLLKDRLGQGDELARAIREVAAGGSAIDPTIAARLSGSQERSDVDRTILDLMAKGFGYAELAQELGTTQEAIDRMVTGLFQRLADEGNVDVFKRLHSAVVDREASARTLRSFVPAQLAAKLASGGEVNAQEEVEVTVLFSDIRGFTTLAEQLPAREVAGILARHLSAMAEVVLEYGGTLDKFAGDAVMAVFGAPDPITDHAERALRCALAMQARQRKLNSEAGAGGLPPLGIGIGVNTGTVIAGTVGGAGRLHYTVLGDAVNLAQRLQAEAGANEILASAATVHASPSIPAESIGPKQVKGRKEPVETYRLLDPEAGTELQERK